MSDLAILILRVSVGIVMVPHGLQKFRGRAKFDQDWKRDYGFPVGSVALAGTVHLLGGLAIILGVFTRVASAVVLLTMLVATWASVWVHHERFGLPRMTLTPAVNRQAELS
jgi:uncharacterized membrane protein YphA (DoxX/SURF4 family)